MRRAASTKSNLPCYSDVVTSDSGNTFDAIGASVATQIRDQVDGCRAVGSSTSKNDCFKTKGFRIAGADLAFVDWVGEVEQGVVRASGWTILRDVVEFAAQSGWAIPTIGEWAGQTIGGVVSTGTHGGSYHYGSIVSSVVRLEVMNAKGEVAILQRGSDDFRATLHAFGSTGIILSVDLQCEPIFDIALQRRRFSIEAYAREVIANPEQFTYRASVWASSTPWVIDYAGHRTAPPSPRGAASKREQRFGNSNSIYEWLARKAKFSMPLSQVGSKRYHGRYDRMLAPIDGDATEILKRRKKQRTPLESEFAVDLTQAEAFILALRDLLATQRNFPDRMIGLRPIAGDECWLSPTQNKSCLWVSLFINEGNPLIPALVELLSRYTARPHWGKHLLLPPASVPALYPRWTDFVERRKVRDPGRVFVNEFAAALGI
jgi:hypothetical protein